MTEWNDVSGVEERLLRHAFAAQIPLNGSIELLPLCNMNCEMCYVRLERRQMEDLGQIRSAEDWLELAYQMKEAGTLFLLLTGGEPLLYPEFQILYQKLRKLGMVVTVNTNGTLINEEWADYFAEYLPRRINITLYGGSEEAYARLCHYPDGFEKTLHAIRLLTKRQIEVRVGCSAVSANAGEVERIRQICKELKVSVFVDSYMYPVMREREGTYPKDIRLSPEAAANVWYQDFSKHYPAEEFPALCEHILQECERIKNECERTENVRDALGEEMQCMAGGCSFTVNWQGMIRPCVMLNEPSLPVFQLGFSKAWKQLRQKCSKMRIPVKCSFCKYRPLCKICVAVAKYEAVDENNGYICQMAAEKYKLLDSIWGGGRD